MSKRVPSVLTNAVGSWPDAAKWMDNYDWLTAIARGNFIVNAGFETWDEGTSFTNPADATTLLNSWIYNKTGTTPAVVNFTREGTTKDSGEYAMKIAIGTSGSADSDIKIKQTVSGHTGFAAETLVLGARVKCSTGLKVRLSITDGVTTQNSGFHSGGGDWELLTAQITINSAPTELTIKVEIDPADFTGDIFVDSSFLYAAPSAISSTAKNALQFFGTDDKIETDALAALTSGWVLAGETWTYASSTTFTISGDKTGKYALGDKIKLTQTTVKYFYVAKVSHAAGTTTVTVSGGDTYTVANAAITSPHFSKMANPQGFPHTFPYTPTISGFGSSTLDEAFFSISGDRMFMEGSFVAGTVGANPGYFTMPSSFKIDDTKIPDELNEKTLLGIAMQLDNSGNTLFSTAFTGLAIYPTSPQSERLYITERGQAKIFDQQNTNAYFTTGNRLSFKCSFPVAGA